MSNRIEDARKLAEAAPLTIKPKTIQIGAHTSPAGFELVQPNGEVFAWTWKRESAEAILAALAAKGGGA